MKNIFFEKDSKFGKKLKEEIDDKSKVLFEKSIDSQLKLKKFIDKEKPIYNETDKKEFRLPYRKFGLV